MSSKFDPNSTNLDDLIDFIQNHTGLVLNERNSNALSKLLGELTTDRLPEILKRTLSSSGYTHPLWQRIIQAITVGETYFFRNKSHIQALRSNILPKLIQNCRQKGFKQLRIWSAGCATGEEPYTIAILLHELIPDSQDWSITILASDINEAYLAYAKQGIYTKRSFRRETEPHIVQRWFTELENGYQINRLIRNQVVFTPFNLITDEYPSYATYTTNMNLIICRNVTIYFDKETTQQVVEKFYQSLSNKGWLLVGHSEPNLDTYKHFKTHNFNNAVVYQKTKEQGRIISELPAIQPVQELPLLPPIRMSKAPPPKSSKVKLSKVNRSEAEPKPTMTAFDNAQKAADNASWSDSLKWLDKAEAEDNLNPQVHYLRGEVYLKLDQIDEAQKSLRRAIYCDSDMLLAHYLLGDLYHTLGNIKRAQHHWSLAKTIILSLPPTSTLPYTDNLTAEMLLGLLDFRLEELKKHL